MGLVGGLLVQASLSGKVEFLNTTGIAELGKPPRRRSAKQSAEDKIREEMMRRYANWIARQAKQF